MSETTKTMAGTFGTTDFLIPLVLEDLSDEVARTRTRGGEGPSISWAVGHLLHYRYHVLNLLGDNRESPFGEMFTGEANDGDEYPTVADMQRQWTEVAELFHAALNGKTEVEWDSGGEGAHDEKSLRDQVVFFGWHEGYHMGAIGAQRKEMGLPGPAEKVMAMRQAAAEAE